MCMKVYWIFMSGRGLPQFGQSPAIPYQAWVGFIEQSHCYTCCFFKACIHTHTHTYTCWRTLPHLTVCCWPTTDSEQTETSLSERKEQEKEVEELWSKDFEEHEIIIEEHLSLAQRLGDSDPRPGGNWRDPALSMGTAWPIALSTVSPSMKRFSSLRGIKKRKDQEGRTGRRQSEPHGLLGTSKMAVKTYFAALF